VGYRGMSRDPEVRLSDGSGILLHSKPTKESIHDGRWRVGTTPFRPWSVKETVLTTAGVGPVDRRRVLEAFKPNKSKYVPTSVLKPLCKQSSAC